MKSYARIPGMSLEGAARLLEPDRPEVGNWVGAPSVVRHAGTAYLAVRKRTPDERGHAVTIYELEPTDGIDSDDLTPRTTLTAADLDVVSVERPALVPVPESDSFGLYLPVDTGAGEWEIRKLADADDPERFDPATARTVLAPRPGGTDAVGVKDPYVFTVAGRRYMFYSGDDGVSEQAHLATSNDGETWHRVPDNPVLGRQYWHDHHTRVSCVVPAPDAPVWLVFYEGSGQSDYGNTWNLRTGVAISHDLRSVVDATTAGPRFSAPTAERATGVEEFATCRYLDLLETDGGWLSFAEVARADGSFDLRATEVTL